MERTEKPEPNEHIGPFQFQFHIFFNRKEKFQIFSSVNETQRHKFGDRLPPSPAGLDSISIDPSIHWLEGAIDPPMGLLFVEVLPQDAGAAVLKCRSCRADAAYEGDILSRDFHGRYGRAYLFHRVVNISLGPKEDRNFTTGLHTVNDVYCSCCQQILGWRYEKAYVESEKYKEGKFILERAMIGKEAQ